MSHSYNFVEKPNPKLIIKGKYGEVVLQIGSCFQLHREYYVVSRFSVFNEKLECIEALKYHYDRRVWKEHPTQPPYRIQPEYFYSIRSMDCLPNTPKFEQKQSPNLNDLLLERMWERQGGQLTRYSRVRNNKKQKSRNNRRRNLRHTRRN